MSSRTRFIALVTALLVEMWGGWSDSLALAAEGPSMAAGSKEAAAMIGDKTITIGELDQIAGARLSAVRMQEYSIRKQALEQIVERTLLEREAAARGVSVQELTRLEAEAKAAPLTVEETRAVYERDKARYKTLSEADALNQIETNLRRQHISERKSVLIRELKAKAGVKVLLEPIRVAVSTDDDPSRGPAEAQVTVVEFADFQCPYCAQVYTMLDRLERQYGNKVRIVYRDFPLSIHKDAAKAAEAAQCAHDQGKFWQMHDSLYARQAKLEVGDLKQRAAELGLDLVQFNQCLDSGKYTAEWKKDMSDGASYGVTGTPTFFINGRAVSGAQPYETFVEVIDEELERAATTKAMGASTVK